VPLAEEATCRTGANIGKPLAITARGFLFLAPQVTAKSNVTWAADNSKMRAARARLKAGTGVQTVAAARARVSQRRRTVSSAALSTVNVIAVIQADPASGSAAPSMITAT
jgi:hypothetical protein